MAKMGKNTAIKRKSITADVAKPSKICKKDDNQTNINVFLKKSQKKTNIKSQNIKNNQNIKKPKQIDEDDESMDESDEIENNSSIEEIQNLSDNNSEAEVDSDDNDDNSNVNEESDEQEDEVSNSNDEENSDNENENSDDEENGNSDEEIDNSDEENENSEEENENSDEEKNNGSIEEEMEEDSFDYKSNNSVFVRGLNDINIEDLFADCKIEKSSLVPNKFTKEMTNAIVKLKDNDSFQKALKKNGCAFNGSIIVIKPYFNREEVANKYKFSVLVEGVSNTSSVNDIFKNFRIKNVTPSKDFKHKIIPGKFHVEFYDIESVKKALSKNGKRFEKNVINVHYRCFDKCVFVRKLNEHVKIEDIFEDCNILHYETTNYPTYQSKSATIYFVDEKSVEKALLKNDTEYDGQILDIKRRKCILFVDGLNMESSIYELFNKDELISYKLIHSYDGTFRGKAILYFKNRESVMKALQKNGQIFNGKKLFINFHDSRKRSFNHNLSIPTNSSHNSRFNRNLTIPTNSSHNSNIHMKKLMLQVLKQKQIQLKKELRQTGKKTYVK